MVAAPAGTVTFAGVEATEESLLLRATTIPPAGALPVRATFPVIAAPPMGELELIDTDNSIGAVTERFAFLFTAPKVAFITGTCRLLTGDVVMVKLAIFAPARTVTETGTEAAPERLLVRETTTPPVGAAARRVTLPVAIFPPTTLNGVIVREERTDVFVPPIEIVRV